MAAPSVAAVGGGSMTSALDPNSTGATGVSPAAGDLVVVFARFNGVTITGVSVQGGGSPFTSLIAGDTSDASDDVTACYYRQWTGSEANNQFEFNLSAAAKGALTAYRITDYAASSFIEAATPAVGTGANPDPPSITPTGGPKDFLYIAFAGMDGETQTFTEPSGYGSLTQANSGTGGAAASNVRVASAHLGTTSSSSENPGVFTAGAPSAGWTAFTVAIHPAGGGGTTYTKTGFGRESA